MKIGSKAIWTILVCVLGSASSARASFHLWKIDEIYSDAGGQHQFIEMHDDFSGENFLNGIQIKSNSHTFSFNKNLSGDTSNKNVLLATDAFAKDFHITPDFTIPNNFFN